MPKGPQGQKRPADAIGLAVLVGRIATGEVSEPKLVQKAERGTAGGKARADKLSPQRKREIAKQASRKRWGKD